MMELLVAVSVLTLGCVGGMLGLLPRGVEDKFATEEVTFTAAVLGADFFSLLVGVELCKPQCTPTLST